MGDRIRAVLKRLGGEQGQTLAEYTLILALVTVVGVVGVTLLGVGLAAAFGGFVGMF